MRAGFVGFWRNGMVSLSAILVMVVALFMIGGTILSSAFLNSALDEIRNKVDINVYLNIDTSEDDAAALKRSLELRPEVADVEYLSREQVLEDFKKRHENDQLSLQALEELGENPFRPVLNVRAKDPSYYEEIDKFLRGDQALSSTGARIVNDINFAKNKVVIDRLAELINGIEQLGFLGILVLIAVSVLITFNTVRLVIYISREEIAVMRLVGADNPYIRGPFIVEGILYGIVSTIITVVALYPLTLWIKNSTVNLYGGIDLFQYYVANLGQIFLILLGAGVLLGAFSSYLAVRKFLKV